MLSASNEQKGLMALVIAAVVLLLYIGVTRQPTRVGSQSELRSDKRVSQSVSSGHDQSSFGQSNQSKLLFETELFQLHSRNVSLRHEGVPIHLSLLAAEPKSHIVPKLPSVVLLHPLEHSARVFEQLGTMQLIAETGHRAYAIDLPGSGSTRVLGKVSHASFIQSAMDVLNADRPVLVTATSSGPYAFEFLFDDSSSVNERLSGLVALSPTGAASWWNEDFRNLAKIHTTLIYGGPDDEPGNAAAKKLNRVHTAKVLQVPTAGHLHFMERPNLMHTAVLDTLKDLED